MRLVIEIDENVYEGCALLNRANEATVIEKAVANGTPLPKGHGNLVDRDAINDKFNDIYREHKSYLCKVDYRYLMNALGKYLETAPTIIKADKESKE